LSLSGFRTRPLRQSTFSRPTPASRSRRREGSRRRTPSPQRLLVELIDPESEVALVQSLYDDPTLGGLVADLSLESQSGFRPIPTLDGGAFLVGVIWLFLVIPARS
jgi:hypothetical protein